MLNWFTARDLKQFAAEAVESFARTYGPDLARSSKESRKAEKQRGVAVRELLRQVTDYQREHRLWLYRKAKLVKLIQAELERRQYPEAFVASIANDLVFRITAGVRRPI